MAASGAAALQHRSRSKSCGGWGQSNLLCSAPQRPYLLTPWLCLHPSILLSRRDVVEVNHFVDERQLRAAVGRRGGSLDSSRAVSRAASGVDLEHMHGADAATAGGEDEGNAVAAAAVAAAAEAPAAYQAHLQQADAFVHAVAMPAGNAKKRGHKRAVEYSEVRGGGGGWGDGGSIGGAPAGGGCPFRLPCVTLSEC